MADLTMYWKRHDTSPAITATLTDLAGNVQDLTGATVKFIMIAAGSSTPKVNAAATVVNPSAGTVSYPPIATDTDTAGTFQGEFEVTLASGKKQTFPDPGYIPIIITADLDNT